MKAKIKKAVQAFNTGRHYSSEGQRIVVFDAEVEDQPEACLIVDLDRNLEYFLPINAGAFKELILANYDKCNYILRATPEYEELHTAREVAGAQAATL